jgi:prophage regulatory protein
MRTLPKLPETGFVRLNQILGDPDATPPIPPIIPVSRTTWWAGVRSGRYPAPVRVSERSVAWDVESIRQLVAALKHGEHHE